MYKVAGAENQADLMTKHLPADTMLKHMAALNIEVPAERTSLAPSSSLASKAVSGHDGWSGDGVYAIQNHTEPRWRFFAPSRINGQGPIKTIMATRVIEGMFCQNGN